MPWRWKLREYTRGEENSRIGTLALMSAKEKEFQDRTRRVTSHHTIAVNTPHATITYSLGPLLIAPLSSGFDWGCFSWNRTRCIIRVRKPGGYAVTPTSSRDARLR
jgi:hypothetical protein